MYKRQRPNHALFVGYAPSSDPEITIATRISYGYSSHNAAAASRNIISYYYNLESLDNLLAVKAEGCLLYTSIQAAAPVDSYVTPEPWAMPGYDSDVIMAAGAFVQGSSIELSADGPVKPPYAVYFQGGLTWYLSLIHI